jgi:hypothetical protein
MGTVNAAQLRVVEETGPAEWIAPRLDGQFGTAGLTVSRDYPAYARYPPLLTFKWV